MIGGKMGPPPALSGKSAGIQSAARRAAAPRAGRGAPFSSPLTARAHTREKVGPGSQRRGGGWGGHGGGWGGPGEAADYLAGAAHVRRLGVVAGHLEGEVRLGRDAQVGRPAGVIAPGPLVLLLGEQVAGCLGAPLVALAAEEGHEDDVFGFEDR